MKSVIVSNIMKYSSLQKFIGAQLVKKFTALCGIR